jgi:hypothetical protein
MLPTQGAEHFQPVARYVWMVAESAQYDADELDIDRIVFGYQDSQWHALRHVGRQNASQAGGLVDCLAIE